MNYLPKAKGTVRITARYPKRSIVSSLDWFLAGLQP